MAPKAHDFRVALNSILLDAKEQKRQYLELAAGELHRLVGGYPGKDHRMPICCSVMRSIMRPGDQILSAPPKGNGASLKIRYWLKK